MSELRMWAAGLAFFLGAVLLIGLVFYLNQQYNTWNQVNIERCTAAGGIWLQETTLSGCFRSLALE